MDTKLQWYADRLAEAKTKETFLTSQVAEAQAYASDLSTKLHSARLATKQWEEALCSYAIAGEDVVPF